MKQRKRILHIENNIQDRDSVIKLFHPDESLCSEVFHFGSVDESPGESYTVDNYLRFMRENHDRTDFIILDLGLSLGEEKKISEWFAAVAPEFEIFFKLATGVRLLERIIMEKVFSAEKIAVYTQFSPGDDLFKNLTSLGKLLWDGAVVQSFYKGESSDPRGLKEYVEKQCGVSTSWIYYSSSDFALRKRIAVTIEDLNSVSDTDLVLGYSERDLLGAPDRYADLYKEKRFRIALIDIVQRPDDVALIAAVREKEEWTDMRKLSTIPLIQKIEHVGGHQTQTIALTNGAYRPGMLRVLMDPDVGVDWVLNADVLDLNIFSTLWRTLRRVRSVAGGRGGSF